MKLVQQHCAKYDGTNGVLSKKEAQDYHREVQNWTLHQKSLQREFRFKNFQESMAFVRKVADLAEFENHHPDIMIFYGRVQLQLTSHVAGGITLNDFILAAKIDELL